MSRPTDHVTPKPSRRERAAWIVALTTALWLAVLAPANAYIDPASTSLIFSIVVAFFAAAGMTVRLTWRRIVGLFKPGSAGASGSDDDAEPTPEPVGGTDHARPDRS